MLAVQEAAELLKRPRNFGAPFQPGTMHAVAGAIDITTPEALETHQDIALPGRENFIHFAGKCDGRGGAEPAHGSETPFVRRPLPGGVERDAMAQGRPAPGEPLQIRFGATAGRKSAPDK